MSLAPAAEVDRKYVLGPEAAESIGHSHLSGKGARRHEYIAGARRTLRRMNGSRL
jgi:hypothetical protein